MPIPEHIDPDDYEALADWIESDDFEPGPAYDVRPIVAARNELEVARQHLIDEVRSAHNAGLSWTAIGAILGVSRQAARQRFGTPAHT
jgi:hypothetical protein